MDFMNLIRYHIRMKDLLYKKVKQDIEQKIAEKQYKEGRLPTERELSEHYKVSRITIRAALKELEQENNLYRVRGRGIFIYDNNNPFAPERKVKELGIVYPEAKITGNYYFSNVLNVLRDSAEKLKYSVKYCSFETSEKFIPGESFLRKIIQQGLKALILTSPIPVKALAYLKENNIRIVLMNFLYKEQLASSVGFDYEYAGEILGEQLVRMGSKAPGFLTGPFESEFGELTQAPVIIRGLKKIYKNWGLRFDASLVKNGSFENNSVAHDVKDLLSSKIDGIFCSDEAVFKIFLSFYYENKKKFPENFAIIGSSPREAYYPFPVLVYQQTEMAEVGINLLHSLITNKKLPDQAISIKPEIKAG